MTVMLTGFVVAQSECITASVALYKPCKDIDTTCYAPSLTAVQTCVCIVPQLFSDYWLVGIFHNNPFAFINRYNLFYF